MPIIHSNNAIEEIRSIQDYYDVTEDKINVRMVCIHAIYGRLSQEIVMDMLSYMYGVYEDIAVFGNDQTTRSKAHQKMNKIDSAVNLIDGDDYAYHLQRLASDDNFTTIQTHPQGGSCHDSGASTPSFHHQTPSSPPPINRISRLYDEDELINNSNVARNLFQYEETYTTDVNNEYSAWNVE